MGLPNPRYSILDTPIKMTPELEKTLRELVALLLKTNAQFNLTGLKTPEDAWNKHILDSVQALETGLFDGDKTLVDVGSGAGFPALALGIARPQLRVFPVEATGKKCGFIREMMAHFAIKGEVLNARSEDVAHDAKWRNHFDLATARALGSFTEVCELCLPLVKDGGHLVLWRGERAEDEARESELVLEELGGQLRDFLPYEIPGAAVPYHLVVVEKVTTTPRKYPRRSGLPKNKPLRDRDFE